MTDVVRDRWFTHVTVRWHDGTLSTFDRPEPHPPVEKGTRWVQLSETREV